MFQKLSLILSPLKIVKCRINFNKYLTFFKSRLLDINCGCKAKINISINYFARFVKVSSYWETCWLRGKSGLPWQGWIGSQLYPIKRQNNHQLPNPRLRNLIIIPDHSGTYWLGLGFYLYLLWRLAIESGNECWIS